jgi:hypothetical protein
VNDTFHLLGYLGRGIQNADETDRLEAKRPAPQSLVHAAAVGSTLPPARGTFLCDSVCAAFSISQQRSHAMAKKAKKKKAKKKK